MSLPESSARAEFLAGVRAVLPLIPGVAPFGLVYGTLALGAGLSVGMAQAMSCIVFAGSSQFVIAQLVGGGAPVVIIGMTAIVFNLRHLLYSASIAPFLMPLRPRWKWLLGYLLIDEAYAFAIIHYQQAGTPVHRHWYFLGAGVTLWSIWQISTAAGIVAGAYVPSGWSLDFTIPLTFIALVVPSLSDRAGIAAALIAGLVAVLAAGVPFNLGLIIATLVGMLVGVAVESMQRRGASARNKDYL